MNALTLLVLILATWRLGSLLQWEHGPFEIFDRLRGWAGVTYDALSQPQASTEIGRGMICLFCNTIWIGTALTVLAALLSLVPWRLAPILPFALSSGGLLVEGTLKKLGVLDG